MRILSFNANGLRSAAQKGFFDWFAQQDADLLCVQETKAQAAQLADPALRPAGYTVAFRDATTKKVIAASASTVDASRSLLTELGWAEFDEEGRYLEMRFGQLSVVSLYFPSGSSGEQRQQFKFRCMDWFGPILQQWINSDRDYVICGDWNIVHTRRDIKNWTSNQKNSGCLPEERAWLDHLFQQQGWIDSYRHLQPEGEDYTWWSQRGAARANNVGWRIDYQVVSPRLRDRLRACAIHAEPKFSDHAPLRVDYAPDTKA